MFKNIRSKNYKYSNKDKCLKIIIPLEEKISPKKLLRIIRKTGVEYFATFERK